MEKKSKGFTLLEIIAVVTLLIVISSVAIPNYLQIVEEQKEKVDLATALQLSETAKTYYIQNKDNNQDKLNDYITKIYGSIPNSKSQKTSFVISLSSEGVPNVSSNNVNFIVNGEPDSRFNEQ